MSPAGGVVAGNLRCMPAGATCSLRATEVGDEAARSPRWMFQTLGARVGDELVDVYGLGRIT
jgi:hypothetical protein